MVGQRIKTGPQGRGVNALSAHLHDEVGHRLEVAVHVDDLLLAAAAVGAVAAWRALDAAQVHAAQPDAGITPRTVVLDAVARAALLLRHLHASEHRLVVVPAALNEPVGKAVVALRPAAAAYEHPLELAPATNVAAPICVGATEPSGPLHLEDAARRPKTEARPQAERLKRRPGLLVAVAVVFCPWAHVRRSQRLRLCRPTIVSAELFHTHVLGSASPPRFGGSR
eukprot:CAMPEP_0119070126 /NCGR_PEP_ID=MMETSP1178-20130426/34783_1 /TAXON_ID=33656 /ORGANISM="unid sp, Strain CCMP2000" /LENGTH=224 /DNA_ID=CAMNT_0007051937 /DNA_START=121 /DNA_END=792 /DNA_ORIENTATION=-